MKITHVETFTVVVPALPGSWHSVEFGPPEWDMVPAVLIRIHTDAGVYGLGEVMRGIPAQTVLAYASRLIGADPIALNLQSLPVGDFFDAAQGIYEAYEMALCDIVGKVRGVPVHQLFGGAYRERVEASLCTGQMTPRDAAATARAAVDAGYRYLKMKATDTDPLIERIVAINAEVGDALKIVIDPMRRFWRPAVLEEFCRRLEPYAANIQCFEDPFDRSNLAGYRLMRHKTHFPLALHLYTPREVIEAVRHEACDYFNLMGGMFGFRQMAAIADADGAPVWHGSAVGFGVSEAAMLHVSAATNNCTLSSDVAGEKIRRDDLIREPIYFSDGFAHVPQAPGLGVELDMDAIERYAVH